MTHHSLRQLSVSAGTDRGSLWFSIERASPGMAWKRLGEGRGYRKRGSTIRSFSYFTKKKKKRGVGAVRDERGKGGTKAARKSKMPSSLQRKHEYFTDSVNNIEPRRNKFLIVPSSLSHISDTYLK